MSRLLRCGVIIYGVHGKRVEDAKSHDRCFEIGVHGMVEVLQGATTSSINFREWVSMIILHYYVLYIIYLNYC